MSYPRPWNSYRQISMQTASPGQLVLMLYDGALRFLEQSLRGFEKDDPIEFNQTINNNVLRAQSILGELNSTLNMEQGWDLARTLRGLYGYLDDRLMESNVRKSPDGIRETIQRLTVLRDAWQEMLHQPATAAARPAETTNLYACG